MNDGFWLTILVHVGVPFTSAFIGLVLGLERMKAKERKQDQRLDTHDQHISELKGDIEIIVGTAVSNPLFIRRKECDVKHSELEEVRTEIKLQGRQLKGVQSFARWYLTHEKNMSLSEVNKIINGG